MFKVNNDLPPAVLKLVSNTNPRLATLDGAIITNNGFGPKNMSSSENEELEQDLDNKRAGFYWSEQAQNEVRPGSGEISPGSDPLVLYAQETNHISVAPPLNAFLKPYQRQGIQFLFNGLFGEPQPAGVLLADDMGLGKTVQVIGLLSALLGKTHVRDPDWVHCRDVRIGQAHVRRTFLIIAPGSVLGNWETEFERFGYFLVEKFHARDRARILRQTKSGRVEILLTTFETARETIDQLNTVDWDAVVVDEVHRIKEPKARVTQALKSLNCRRRIGLSGTLLQNKYDELWCLLDWANPGCLGSQQSFAHKFSQPIERGLRIDAKKVELARARQLQSDLNQLKEKYVLRRTKDNTIRDQLPKKTDQIVFCHPSQFQLSVFKALLNSDEMQFVHHGLEMCGCGRQPERQARHCCFKVFDAKGQNLSWVQIVFTFLHLFLKVANHVSLLLPYHTSSEIQRSEAERYCQIAFRETPEFLDASFRSRFEELCNPKYSGKMQVLVKMLRAIEEEEGSSKVLLFSYSTHVLDILESFVQSQNYEYRRLDGSTRMESRMDLVNEFNDNPEVFLFLISTKAGGLGLNITSANVVIVFDPNWNPSHDLQAQDRAYRLGQTRDVRVYRLITAGTVEENIYLRQVYKQQLGRNALDGEKAKRHFVAVQGQAKGELFGIKNLLSVRFAGKYLMNVILDRQNQMNDLVKRNQNYQLADYLLDQPEQESKTGDDASFLEELVTEDPDLAAVPVKSGMAAVLECTQVVQFHANHELVGGSKLEDQISAAAAKSVRQGLCGEEEMAWENVDFLPTQVLNEPKNNEDPPLTQPKALNLEPKREFDQTLKEVQRQYRVLKVEHGSRVLYGQTPRAIQDRDFKNLADFLDLSVQACVQHVLQLDLDGRLALLEKFYLNSGVPEVSGLFLEVRRDLQNVEKEAIQAKQVKNTAKMAKEPLTNEKNSTSSLVNKSEAAMFETPQKVALKQRYQAMELSSPSEDEEEERVVKPPPKQRYQRSQDPRPIDEQYQGSKGARPNDGIQIRPFRSLNDTSELVNYESILNSPKKSKKLPQSCLDTAKVQATGSRSNEDYSILLNSPLKRCHNVEDSLETSENKNEGSLFDLWVQTGKIKKK